MKELWNIVTSAPKNPCYCTQWYFFFQQWTLENFIQIDNTFCQKKTAYCGNEFLSNQYKKNVFPVHQKKRKGNQRILRTGNFQKQTWPNLKKSVVKIELLINYAFVENKVSKSLKYFKYFILEKRIRNITFLWTGRHTWQISTPVLSYLNHLQLF